MNGTSVKGLPVRPEGSQSLTGTVFDLALDWDSRRVLALLVQGAEEDVQYVLPVDDIVTVTDEVRARDDAAIVPLADRPDIVAQATFNQLLQEEALTEDGTSQGKVVDVEFEPGSYRIVAYDLVQDLDVAFREGPKRVDAERVVTGAHSLLVLDGPAPGSE